MRRYLPLSLAPLAAALLVAGCGSQRTESKPPPSIAEQIETIQNDPKMPPQAKAAAIAGLQQAQQQQNAAAQQNAQAAQQRKSAGK